MALVPHATFYSYTRSASTCQSTCPAQPYAAQVIPVMLRSQTSSGVGCTEENEKYPAETLKTNLALLSSYTLWPALDVPLPFNACFVKEPATIPSHHNTGPWRPLNLHTASSSRLSDQISPVLQLRVSWADCPTRNTTILIIVVPCWSWLANGRPNSWPEESPCSGFHGCLSNAASLAGATSKYECKSA